jgi:hypothetical protein
MEPSAPEALARLHDVVAPAPVAWAPQTVGWAVLAGMLAVALAWLGGRAWKRARANRYRKVALAEIDRIATSLQDDPAAALGAVNEILKRAALTTWPRAEVASLAGRDWLEFLDATSGGQDFRSGPGRALADRVYAPGGLPAGEEERKAFLQAVRRWVHHHRRSDTTGDAGMPGPARRVSRGEEEEAA